MRAIVLPALLVALTACGRPDAPAHPDGRRPCRGAPEAAASLPASARTLPPVLVYKTEGCGCCNAWVEHLRAAGFEVDARNVTDIASIKAGAGIDPSISSCHTALVDGYVVEGHVPADVIERLLAERPDIAGLAVPEMPVGSPGMEGDGAKPYQVLALDHQGRTTRLREDRSPLTAGGAGIGPGLRRTSPPERLFSVADHRGVPSS